MGRPEQKTPSLSITKSVNNDVVAYKLPHFIIVDSFSEDLLNKSNSMMNPKSVYILNEDIWSEVKSNIEKNTHFRILVSGKILLPAGQAKLLNHTASYNKTWLCAPVEIGSVYVLGSGHRAEIVKIKNTSVAIVKDLATGVLYDIPYLSFYDYVDPDFHEPCYERVISKG